MPDPDDEKEVISEMEAPSGRYKVRFATNPKTGTQRIIGYIRPDGRMYVSDKSQEKK